MNKSLNERLLLVCYSQGHKSPYNYTRSWITDGKEEGVNGAKEGSNKRNYRIIRSLLKQTSSIAKTIGYLHKHKLIRDKNSKNYRSRKRIHG